MKLGLFTKLLETAETLKESLPRKIFIEKSNALLQDAHKAITYVLDEAGNLKSEVHNATLEDLTAISLSGIAKVLEQVRSNPDVHKSVVDKVVDLVMPHYENERNEMLNTLSALRADSSSDKHEIAQLKAELSKYENIIELPKVDSPQ